MPDVKPSPVLSVRFTLDRPGLHLDVAFDAHPGITALVGPSGVGKSTTLEVIAGLVDADHVELRFGGIVWQGAGSSTIVPIHERQVGFVFQTPALFPHLDVDRNVGFGIPKRDGRSTRETKVREALARFSASHLAGRRPSTLSGGEAQRVALARTFAAKPAVVLLDEPLSALDKETKVSVAAALRKAITDGGIVALLVSHDAHDVDLADRVLELDGGRIRERVA